MIGGREVKSAGTTHEEGTVQMSTSGILAAQGHLRASSSRTSRDWACQTEMTFSHSDNIVVKAVVWGQKRHPDSAIRMQKGETGDAPLNMRKVHRSTPIILTLFRFCRRCAPPRCRKTTKQASICSQVSGESLGIGFALVAIVSKAVCCRCISAVVMNRPLLV